MNPDKLKSVIKLHHEKQSDLADALGISLSCMNYKINAKNNASFRQTEIAAIKSRYNLSADEVDAIFFASELS